MYRRIIYTALALVAAGCAAAKQHGTAVPQPLRPDTAAAGAQARPVNTLPPDIRARARRAFLNGSVLEMRGQYRQAIAEYRRSLLYNPANGAAYFGMGKCYRELHVPDSAEIFARRCVDTDPWNADARRLLIDLYAASYNYDSAVAQCQALLKLRPDDVDAHYTIAQLTQHSDPHLSLRHYEMILERYGEDPNVLLSLSEIYFELKDYRQAAQTMAQLRALRPDEPTIHRLLTEAYLKGDLPDSALSALRQADLHLPAKEFEEYYLGQAGGLLQDWGRQEMAQPPGGTRRLAETLARHHRARSSWLTTLYCGLLRYNLDSADHSADTLLAAALKDTAATVREWTRVALRYMADRHVTRFIRIAAPTAIRYRYDDRATYLLGAAYYQARNYDSAVLWLTRSVRLRDDNADAWGQLGAAYNHLNRHPESDSAYEQALLFEPDNALYMNNYAYALAVRGQKLNRALELIKKAVDLQPGSPSFLDTYGWVYFRLKDYSRAVRYLQQAVDAGPASAEVLEHLGDALQAAGDPQRAREAYQNALGLNPGSDSLRRKAGNAK